MFTENFLINLSFLGLFLNCFISWIFYSFKTQNTRILTFLNYLTTFIFSVFFVERWVNSHHFPISNLYESLLFLSFCINLSVLWIYSLTNNLLLYCISSPCALLINAFAAFCLPNNLQKISPLIPALKSNWLLMHVTVMIVSYSTLIIGSLLSIAFIVFSILYIKKTNSEFAGNLLYAVSNFTLTEEKNNNNITSILKTLDNLSYRFIGLSFPFLTIGIISGAVWANETWGSYWNWDPKETWALITWLIFAIYLHTRLIYGKTGGLPALIGSFGFIVVWICYLGVNLLGKGLHSYGWFN